MRVLLVQLAPAAGDLAGNAARVEHALAEHPDAELAVFPELFLSGYELPNAAGLAVAPDDPVMRALRESAERHRTAIIIGFTERTDEGDLANSAACIGSDGELAGVYRKTHLFGMPEQQTFAAGEELLLIRLDDRLIAPLICFDVEFPEPARALARSGAELLVTIAANMEPYAPEHELVTRARALENRTPHVYVNQVGSHRGLRFVGGSCAIDSGGVVLASAGAGPLLLEVEVPTARQDLPDEIDYLQHVRPELRVRAPTTIAQRGEGPG